MNVTEEGVTNQQIAEEYRHQWYERPAVQEDYYHNIGEYSEHDGVEKEWEVAGAESQETFHVVQLP